VIPRITGNLTPLSNAPNQNPPPSDLTKYAIKPGDNASAIATRHEISLTTLRALNSSMNLDILQIGKLIVVPIIDLPPPAQGSVPAGPPPFIKYTVVSGDSFTEIANNFGVEMTELISVNPSIDIDALTIDQQLLIPKLVPIPIVSRTEINQITAGIELVAADLGILPHTLIANNPGISVDGLIFAGKELRIPNNEGIILKVQNGDTLAAIAAIFGSSIEAIISDPRNGVLDPNGLIASQEIILPIKVPDFIWPANGIITDAFGVCRSWDCSVRHKGTDIDQYHTPGAPVISMAPGRVTFSGGQPYHGLGFYAEIDHGNGWSSSYAHFNEPPIVSEGQFVEQGQTLGYSGTTGHSTGYHLHLEMKHNGFYLDATNYLP
jgi:LysM repeat protein